jgi:hypothetical protein
VPGGLSWEAWLEAQQRERPHLLGFALPHPLTFVGAGMPALAWTAGFVFYRDGVDVLPRLGLAAVWLMGAVTTALCAVLVLPMAGRLQLRSWEQAGLC